MKSGFLLEAAASATASAKNGDESSLSLGPLQDPRSLRPLGGGWVSSPSWGGGAGGWRRSAWTSSTSSASSSASGWGAPAPPASASTGWGRSSAATSSSSSSSGWGSKRSTAVRSGSSSGGWGTPAAATTTGAASSIGRLSGENEGGDGGGDGDGDVSRIDQDGDGNGDDSMMMAIEEEEKAHVFLVATPNDGDAEADTGDLDAKAAGGGVNGNGSAWKNVPIIPKNANTVPKNHLAEWYSVHRNGFQLREELGCYKIVEDADAGAHLRRFTCVFVCPSTGEAFASGRWECGPHEVRKEEIQSSMAMEVEEENGTNGRGEETNHGEENGGREDDFAEVVWYRKKKHAEHAAAARALDCFRYRAAVQEAEEDEEMKEDDSIHGSDSDNNDSSAAVAIDDVGNDANRHLSGDRHRRRQRRSPPPRTQFRYGMDEPYLLNQGPQLCDSVAAALLATEASSDPNRSQPLQQAPQPPPRQQRRRPVLALRQWYDDRNSNFAVERLGKNPTCFVTWDDGNERTDLKRFTSILTCPGERFASGRLSEDEGGGSGRRERFEVHDGAVWYARKKLAEEAAAARAVDCLRYRERLLLLENNGGGTHSNGEGSALDDVQYYGQDEPYLREEAPPLPVPPALYPLPKIPNDDVDVQEEERERFREDYRLARRQGGGSAMA